jgi:hypothetical protein
MEYTEDEALLEDDEGSDEEPVLQESVVSANKDTRRLIERRLELQRLREQLDDPGFYYDFD